MKIRSSKSTILHGSGYDVAQVEIYGNTVDGSWANVGSAGFSAGEVYCTSLALGSGNTPYGAYMDYINGGKAGRDEV